MQLAVLDLETDPFKVGRTPEPFVSGYFDGSKFVSIWDADPLRVIDRTVSMLESEPPSIIYWHNGGKFDVYKFMRYLSGNIKIIANRIVSCVIGRHEFRDSYAIMPFPLRSYKKDEIDYDKMEREVRDRHHVEIVDYLRGDCEYLHELVTTFHTEFGNRLTIGGTAMRTIKDFHRFEIGSPRFDTEVRKRFYFGGRNQCFETGLIYTPLQVMDVNSMYLHAMRNMLHPISTGIVRGRDPDTEDACFVVAQGKNHGAFPVRVKPEGLNFTQTDGTFGVSIHEWRTALETGTFEPSKVLEVYRFTERTTFQEFVDYCFERRDAAKKMSDAARDLLYKFLGNSGYGKFSQNPENFFDYQLTRADELPNDPCDHCGGLKLCSRKCHLCWRLNDGEEPLYANEENQTTGEWWCMFCGGSGKKWRYSEGNDDYVIWAARPRQSFFHNVATGASITGGARSVLLAGINLAVRPLYCDTDSIIAEGHRGLPVSQYDLGAWKIEATGDAIAIAGKKLYCVYSYSPHCEHSTPIGEGLSCKKCGETRKESERVTLTNGRVSWVVKKAHKGVRLTGKQLLKIATGETVEYASPVPAFKRDGRVTWITRQIRMTGK